MAETTTATHQQSNHNAHTVPPRGAPAMPTAGSATRRRPLGLSASRILGGPWQAWQQDNRRVTIPHAFDWLERDGTVDNLRRLAADSSGLPDRRGLWFTDSDLYKALEGVAWDLARAPSPELEGILDTLVPVVGGAQEADGYINSFVQAGLDSRWGHLARSHELYCIGHLIQAGIAHRRTTGRNELFDIAVRAADCAVAEFGEGRNAGSDGHEEIEMALVELFRETGGKQYLDLARQLIDMRGHGNVGTDGTFGPEYFQDAHPVRDAQEVVGHAVRAVYLLAGAVDLYLETGEDALLAAAVRQWDGMTDKKTYHTGALGSRFDGEAFGDPFELPPDLVYGETCASIGNIMLSWRLLLATGHSRFADAIERSLYNLLAASTSLTRDAFFYSNPAQRRRHEPAAPVDTRPNRADAPGTRPQWFECACCPPNVIRTIASLAAYLATSDDRGMQIHQYMPSQLEVDSNAGRIGLEVATDYPVSGLVEVRVTKPGNAAWQLSLRIPAWSPSTAVLLNGAPVEAAQQEGYLVIDREWSAGDVVALTLDVAPRFSIPHPAIDAARGTVAIERGPVVYCIEDIDQDADIDLDRIEINVATAPTEKHGVPALGADVIALQVRGFLRDDASWAGAAWWPIEHVPAIEGRFVELTAIPYALWANRGPSSMRTLVPMTSVRPA